MNPLESAALFHLSTSVSLQLLFPDKLDTHRYTVRCEHGDTVILWGVSFTGASGWLWNWEVVMGGYSGKWPHQSHQNSSESQIWLQGWYGQTQVSLPVPSLGGGQRSAVKTDSSLGGDEPTVFFCMWGYTCRHKRLDILIQNWCPNHRGMCFLQHLEPKVNKTV